MNRAYSANARQRGGTLIVEDVVTLEEHGRLLSDPDAYRPARCPHCGHDRLHAHDFRERHLRGEGLRVSFRRYCCTACAGIWQILAGFMARHLHRRWRYVEAATEMVTSADGGGAPGLSLATLRRWETRLLSSASVVFQALVLSGVELGELLSDCCRHELVAEMVRAKLLSATRPLAELAGWLHRVQAGLRLM